MKQIYLSKGFTEALTGSFDVVDFDKSGQLKDVKKDETVVFVYPLTRHFMHNDFTGLDKSYSYEPVIYAKYQPYSAENMGTYHFKTDFVEINRLEVGAKMQYLTNDIINKATKTSIKIPLSSIDSKTMLSDTFVGKRRLKRNVKMFKKAIEEVFQVTSSTKNAKNTFMNNYSLFKLISNAYIEDNKTSYLGDFVEQNLLSYLYNITTQIMKPNSIIDFWAAALIIEKDNDESRTKMFKQALLDLINPVQGAGADLYAYSELRPSIIIENHNNLNLNQTKKKEPTSGMSMQESVGLVFKLKEYYTKAYSAMSDDNKEEFIIQGELAMNLLDEIVSNTKMKDWDPEALLLLATIMNNLTNIMPDEFTVPVWKDMDFNNVISSADEKYKKREQRFNDSKQPQKQQNLNKTLKDNPAKGISRHPGKDEKLVDPKTGKVKYNSSIEKDILSGLLLKMVPKTSHDMVKYKLSQLKSGGMKNASQDTQKIHDWIREICRLPFQKQEFDIDIDKVRESLNKTHFGLDEVKDRIIEYMVMEKKDISSPTILALVGPPGIGKTTIAYAAAEAIGRHHIKIALGGVGDTRLIKGFPITYLGSQPGNIVRGFQGSPFNNPVVLLDEIDKLNVERGADSALLEVLDPTQSPYFRDDYIDLEYDISNALYICTANNLGKIPEALRDRLEIIHLESYTLFDKLKIAPIIIEQLNIVYKFELNFTDSAIKTLIIDYTNEAGVRELRRLLEKIYRKVMVLDEVPKSISQRNINDYFKSYDKAHSTQIDSIMLKDKPDTIFGEVNGLYASGAGGGRLVIEASRVGFSKLPKIALTGNWKTVMEQSAQKAFDYIQAHSKELKVDEDALKNIYHLSSRDGSTPKDGPSAGAALTTALLSEIHRVKIPDTVAMTGTITLKGYVGAIGGLRDKIVGSYKDGVRTYYIPYANKPDLDKIPAEVLAEIEVIPVKYYSEIWDRLFKTVS